jgi:hypothetical protein
MRTLKSELTLALVWLLLVVVTAGVILLSGGCACPTGADEEEDAGVIADPTFQQEPLTGPVQYKQAEQLVERPVGASNVRHSDERVRARVGPDVPVSGLPVRLQQRPSSVHRQPVVTSSTCTTAAPTAGAWSAVSSGTASLRPATAYGRRAAPLGGASTTSPAARSCSAASRATPTSGPTPDQT